MVFPPLLRTMSKYVSVEQEEYLNYYHLTTQNFLEIFGTLKPLLNEISA